MEVIGDKSLTAMKVGLRARVDEWLGNDIPEEDDDDYDHWQSMLAEIDAIESLEDVIEYLGDGEDAAKFLEEYEVSYKDE